MTTSPKGYPFERIEYDEGQMNSLHGHLEDAADEVSSMQLVLRNVTDNLEGRGQALEQAKVMAGDVAAAFESPAARIRRIKGILLAYGQGAEEHGGRANQLMESVTEAQTAVATADASLADAQGELSTWERSDDYDAWTSGQDVTTPPRTLHAHDERFREAVQTAQTGNVVAASDLEDAWAAWERAFESWDDAYARAVAALASVDENYMSAADAAALASLSDADSPAVVAAIWNSLTDAQKEHYLEAYPGFIGNLEGVPHEYRIAANVKTLEKTGESEWGEPLDTTIDRLLAEYRERDGLPIALNLWDKNQPTAAVLYVDDYFFDPENPTDPLNGVENLNVLIGGMMSEAGQIRDWSQSARDLNEVTNGRSATIAWFGYDTPNFATVGSSGQPRVGAELLTNALRGLDLAAPSGATTTVIAHSYGTTTAFLAVGSTSDDLGVDNLISLGSAGLTDRALGGHPDQGLDFSGTALFTTRGPNDWVSLVGRTFSDHSIDPDSLEGVTTFQSDGGTLPDGTHVEDTPGHGTHSEANLPIGAVVNDGGYLQDGSESFANIANIINYGEPLTTDDR